MTPSPRQPAVNQGARRRWLASLTSGTRPRSTSPSPPSSIAPSRVAHIRLLDELDHLPVSDEIPLGVRRVGEEAAGDRQLAPIGSRCLLRDPPAVDPPLSNQTYRGLDLRASAITEPLEHAAINLERLLWIDLAHRHMILSHSDRFGETAACRPPRAQMTDARAQEDPLSVPHAPRG